jgi:hypothetical protein
MQKIGCTRIWIQHLDAKASAGPDVLSAQTYGTTKTMTMLPAVKNYKSKGELERHHLTLKLETKQAWEGYVVRGKPSLKHTLIYTSMMLRDLEFAQSRPLSNPLCTLAPSMPWGYRSSSGAFWAPVSTVLEPPN